MRLTTNPIALTTEIAASHSPPMANVRWIFSDDSPSSTCEVRLHFGRQTLPGASTLTRPGHVRCPGKKHPASARALGPRLPRSWRPWLHRSRPRSRSLPFDAAVRLSHAVSGSAALSSWVYGQLLLVGTLALRYVHHPPPLAWHHMTMPSLCPMPPLHPRP